MLIIHIVNDFLQFLEYHKAQFWDHLFSTFFSIFVAIHNDGDIGNFADNNTYYRRN